MGGNAPTITWEVMVDWDMTDWSQTPDFTDSYDDITADVKSILLRRGKETEEGNSPAATLDIQIKTGMVSKYSPPNVAGPLYGKLLPWRVTRVRAYHNAVWYNVFFGFISKIAVRPGLDKQSVYIYITDGIDLLARQLVTQDYSERAQMSDGEAVNLLLDEAGWSPTRRNIDLDGGDLFSYPATYQY